MILEIDGREIKTVSDFHDRLMACPGMPNFYGRNLDAFFEVLTGFIERPFKIVWRNAAVSRANLGQDFDGFVLAMSDAAQETHSSERKFEFEIIE
tara:strand:- start:182 stop:466 length:285 start_codon:yes stop_codon:yes gene_type:complete